MTWTFVELDSRTRAHLEVIADCLQRLVEIAEALVEDQTDSTDPSV